ncbi:MAG TPA: sulfurtransferase TusA family protein [bacterium]|nr:sulfurtransferase TusA family protein [bacterium]HOL47747.1 sulfurtransferase TusA family protein [bacterium]HPQ17699.1 sulfurtransferase TusA family protein [bacterium]
MATHTLDCKGLACPQPVLKVSIQANKMAPGDVLDVYADCSTFPDDIKSWCSRMGKTLVFCNNEAGVWHAQIQF